MTCINDKLGFTAIYGFQCEACFVCESKEIVHLIAAGATAINLALEYYRCMNPVQDNVAFSESVHYLQAIESIVLALSAKSTRVCIWWIVKAVWHKGDNSILYPTGGSSQVTCGCTWQRAVSLETQEVPHWGHPRNPSTREELRSLLLPDFELAIPRPTLHVLASIVVRHCALTTCSWSILVLREIVMNTTQLTHCRLRGDSWCEHSRFGDKLHFSLWYERSNVQHNCSFESVPIWRQKSPQLDNTTALSNMFIKR